VVENGSTDKTLDICLEHSVTCFSYPYLLGHDVGRAIGAREATGDVLLFLDGDMVLAAEELLPFAAACYNDVDIALNNVNPFLSRSSMIDYVSMAKSYLNRSLQLPHLGYSSLTAVPHAMKKQVAEKIGYENLTVPPKALAIAAMLGFNIQHASSVDVIKPNKLRNYNHSKHNFVADMILGDHVEAIRWVQAAAGDRLFFSDSIRKRHILRQLYSTDPV
jgi:glycosyltransferase involved in cell wall biosynthesis